MKRLILPFILLLTGINLNAQEDICEIKDPVLFTRMPDNYISYYPDKEFEYSIMSSAKTIQEDSIRKSKIYRIWIKAKSSPVVIPGFLYNVEDSSIMIADYRNKEFYNYTGIEYNNIRSIRLKNMNSTINRILLGTLSGLVVGGILGFNSYHPCESFCFLHFSPAESTAIGAVTGGLGGIVIGALTAPISIKIKIPTGGSLNKFNKQQARLKKHAYLN